MSIPTANYRHLKFLVFFYVWLEKNGNNIKMFETNYAVDDKQANAYEMGTADIRSMTTKDVIIKCSTFFYIFIYLNLHPPRKKKKSPIVQSVNSWEMWAKRSYRHKWRVKKKKNRRVLCYRKSFLSKKIKMIFGNSGVHV